MILHLACLNIILNILPSCGNICISGLAVGHMLQLALVTTSPSLPYMRHYVCICVCEIYSNPEGNNRDTVVWISADRGHT